MYIGHGRLCVCLSVPGRIATQNFVFQSRNVHTSFFCFTDKYRDCGLNARLEVSLQNPVRRFSFFLYVYG